MHTLDAADNSKGTASTAGAGERKPAGGPVADYAEDDFASRWEPQILMARSRPVDPYAVWLEQSEAGRRTAPAQAAPARARRFQRRRPRKAPWDVITVKLTGEDR